MLIGRLEIYPIIIFLAPILNIRSVSKNIHSRKSVEAIKVLYVPFLVALFSTICTF